MSNVSEYSIGLMHEVAIEAAKAGITPKEFASLKESVLRKVCEVIRGHASIVDHEHFIDSDATPGWAVGAGLTNVEEHKKHGIFKWDPARVSLHLIRSADGRRSVMGTVVRKELLDAPVLNAAVLDYLLVNQHLIPEEWKNDEQGYDRYIFFFGTTYRNNTGGADLFIRYIYWDKTKWREGSRNIRRDWSTYTDSIALLTA